MPRDADGLTPKQARFVSEYLVDCNATRAALRAGYAPGRAEQTGCNLCRNGKVANAIARGLAEQAQRTQETADGVISDLKRLQGGAEGAVQYGAAIRAAELRGKHLGMFADRVKLSQDADGLPLIPDGVLARLAGTGRGVRDAEERK